MPPRKAAGKKSNVTPIRKSAPRRTTAKAKVGALAPKVWMMTPHETIIVIEKVDDTTYSVGSVITDPSRKKLFGSLTAAEQGGHELANLIHTLVLASGKAQKADAAINEWLPPAPPTPEQIAAQVAELEAQPQGGLQPTQPGLDAPPS